MPKTLKFTQTTVNLFLFICLLSNPISGFAQEVKNVPDAFAHVSIKPEVIVLNNAIDVPTKNGHFQGVQVINSGGIDKLLISGSSAKLAYILQSDLASQKTEKLLYLMGDPYRHAGGFQVIDEYLAVGIEDNIIKTSSKVRFYNHQNDSLANALPSLSIEREGEPEQKTSGAVGLLSLDSIMKLMVVSNWDSRIWDFYSVNAKSEQYDILHSFTAPDEWPAYQSINLIKDDNAIYAIGFYGKGRNNKADLILVSRADSFEPIMLKISSKRFTTSKGLAFDAAAGLQVDQAGNLHIWGTEKISSRKILVNKF